MSEGSVRAAENGCLLLGAIVYHYAHPEEMQAVRERHREKMQQARDEAIDHLETAVDTGWIILTNDADFAGPHGDFDHPGIVLHDDQDVPVSTFIRGIRTIERFVPESELRGRIV